MDIEDAFDHLPETHAAALRLRARGFDHEAIAARLGLEPTTVAPLLRIADAKLEALMARGRGRRRRRETAARAHAG